MRLDALDLALWDIKGKMLGLPVHAVLGGMVRNYCECYNTAGMIPGVQPGMSVKERAQLTIAAGYRAFRMGAADTPANTTYNTHEALNQLYDECVQAREGVGKNGDWAVDFHQRFDLSEAIRGCDLIKDLAPYFVEDPVRAEAFLEDLPRLRRMVPSLSRRAKNGAIAGTSISWWKITTSITCARRFPMSAASPR